MNRNIAIPLTLANNILDILDDNETLDCNIYYNDIINHEKQRLFIIRDTQFDFMTTDELERNQLLRVIKVHINSKREGTIVRRKDVTYTPGPDTELNTKVQYYGREFYLMQKGLILFIRPQDKQVGKAMPAGDYYFQTLDDGIRREPYIYEKPIKSNKPRIANYGINPQIFKQSCTGNKK